MPHTTLGFNSEVFDLPLTDDDKQVHIVREYLDKSNNEVSSSVRDDLSKLMSHPQWKKIYQAAITDTYEKVFIFVKSLPVSEEQDVINHHFGDDRTTIGWKLDNNTILAHGNEKVFLLAHSDVIIVSGHIKSFIAGRAYQRPILRVYIPARVVTLDNIAAIADGIVKMFKHYKGKELIQHDIEIVLLAVYDEDRKRYVFVESNALDQSTKKDIEQDIEMFIKNNFEEVGG